MGEMAALKCSGGNTFDCRDDSNHEFYDTSVDDIRATEYPMLKDAIYLDHAGTTLYPKSSIEAFLKDLTSSLYGNPHSASSSSQLSTSRVEDVRLKALEFFHADPDHFDLIFVGSCTAGIKLVMECFREQEHGFWYGYHKDSHTSLVGVREAAQAGQHCFTSDEEVEQWLGGYGEHVCTQEGNVSKLFAYPAQSNMNGRRLPLSWARRLRSSRFSTHAYSLLDAASLVSTSLLDLSSPSCAPDYTVLSFNKIFGFPDLGALIVRKAAAAPLHKRSYFGGGTVEMVTCGKENWHISKQGALHEQLEDGTLPIHSIIALDHGLDVHKKLYYSQERIALHTGILANRLAQQLSSLRHHNRREVCNLYTDARSSYADGKTQGPIVAFNLCNSEGEYISNAEVEKLASVKNIHIRSGGLCNPGGTASCLDLAPWELKRNFSAGHRCGDDNDIVAGKPTGMLRMSLGAMSSPKDIETFISFIEEFFVQKEQVRFASPMSAASSKYLYIESLTIYPIKSCAGWQIPAMLEWDVRAEGLAWDREWCLVHQGTRKSLGQKKYPRMALLRPEIDLQHGVLKVRYHGYLPVGLAEEICVPLSEDPRVYDDVNDVSSSPTFQVCGDDVLMKTYASGELAKFFTSALGTPCTLARFPPTSNGVSSRHSKPYIGKAGIPSSILLSNESPILTISRSSLNRLNEQIKLTEGKATHASVFRANIILAEDPTTFPGQEQPYIEDDWQSLNIGERLTFDVLGGCRRCQMVCIDQTTAEKNEEPFVTLAKTRRKQGKIYFGVHTALSHRLLGQGARIKAGNPVRPMVKGADASG